MIFLRKRKIAFILFFSFLLILATSIWAYNIGISVGLKSNSELILFLGFLFSGIQIILSIILLVESKKKEKDFYSLMFTIKSGGVLSEKKIKKLGRLGIEIKEALNAAHDITAKKSLKIAGLNGLLKMIIEFIQAPILIVNLNGEILEASPLAREQVAFNPDLRLCECFPELSIRKAFKEASSTHLPVEQKDKIMFFPVFSTIGDIAYFIVDISKNDALSKLIKNFPLNKFQGIEKKKKRNFFGF